jgi:glucose dehydrogenase
VLGAGGLYIMVTFTGTPYFLVAGVGIAVSGIFIATGKRTGLYLYFATFGIMFIWSLIETGGNIGTMMSRLFVPALIGLYLCTEKIRARLH